MNTYEQFSNEDLDAMVRKVGTMDAGFVMLEWLKRKRELIHRQMEQVEGERNLSLLQGRIALISDISHILTSLTALTEGANHGRA